MEGETKKTIKYLMNQPATVHNYGKLKKSENPRSHSSPTSILRKFPHSLRHDQKHQTKIKRNSSPINIIISEVSAAGAEKNEQESNRKSWSFGDDISNEGKPASLTNESAICRGLHILGDASLSKRKLSNTSIGSELSNESEVWKPQSTIVNKKNCQSVQELNEESESGRSLHKSSLVSIESLSLQSEESIKRPDKKLSVINNTFNECFGTRSESIDRVSEMNNEIQSPIHKSTPNLLNCSASLSDRSSTESDSSQEKLKVRRGSNGRHLPLRGSDSLPHLDQRHRIINSILPRISRTISERPESLSGGRKNNLAKVYIKSESHINSQNLYNGEVRQREPYFSLTNILDVDRKSDGDRSDDENEGLTLIDNHRSIIIRSGKDHKEPKSRWPAKKTVDIMPTLRNLMGKRSKCENRSDDVDPTGACAPLMTSPYVRTESFSSLNIPQIKYFDVNDENLSVKKCETVDALTTLIQSESPFCVEPMKPVNRLRVPPNGFYGSTSRMCSRCSSLLSMASSSRYSINTTGSGFVNCSQSSERQSEPNLLCKLCLMEVPVSMSLKIDSCGCIFCKDCMRLYVEFEIQEGAYDISCPDAQCREQGIVSTDEVETLVTSRMMERYRRFRLNHEVDMDRNRTWCPRAGCETVCEICPREKCAPMSVHCPTCDSDFCSNCKNAWHKGLTCEENSKKLAKEGRADFMEPGIPFDSDSIKCCPMCNVPIEKDEGCAQMMCKRCKHVFCWYCLASLDDDFLLRHYDKGPCKNKLGHTRASVIWHRTQVIGIFAGLGLLLLVASPLLLLAAPCIVCCKCRVCSGNKLDAEDDLPEDSGT